MRRFLSQNTAVLTVAVFFSVIVFVALRILFGTAVWADQNSEQMPHVSDNRYALLHNTPTNSRKGLHKQAPSSTAETAGLSPLTCALAAGGEFIIPGLGYLVSQQYGKMVGFGLSRWVLKSSAQTQMSSDYYQEDVDDYYKTEEASNTKSGKSEVVYNYNRETWDAELYSRLDLNLGFYNVWDLYEGSCAPHPSTFDPPLAVFKPQHYATKPLFWIPTVIGLSLYFLDDKQYTWNLGRGLKFERIGRETALKQYTTGIGEEAFFRGVVQKASYIAYRDSFSEETSWYLGLLTSSTIFGLAHNGQSGSASAFTAFLFGLYQGYVYQPTPLAEFDLTTVIAIHTFWNLFSSLAAIKNPKVNESDEPVDNDYQIELANVYIEF